MRIGNLDARGQAVFDDAQNTAAAPAISFDSDTDTGLYRSAADTLGFSTGGTERLSVASTGATFANPVLAAAGSAAAPSQAFSGDTDTGFYSAGADEIGMAVGGSNAATLSASALTLASGHDIVLSGGGELTGLPATPSGATAAVSKAYADSLSAGLDPKESVKAATVSDPGGTYNSSGGTGGTGEYTAMDLTAGAFDGVTLAVNDRVLIKNASPDTENGIYVVTTAGAAGVIERSSDQDGTPSNEVSGGNFTFVEEGTTNANTGWVLTGTGELTLNTDSIVWTQFSGAGSVTAGIGLSQSGTTLFMDIDSSLSTETVVAGDEIAFHDVSFSNTATDTGSRKTTISSFLTTLGIMTQVGGANPITASDGVAVTNAGTSVDIELDITNLGAATIAGADELVFDDGATGNHAKTTVTNFLADLDIVNSLGGNGFAVQTASDTYTARSVAVSGAGDAAGLSVTNGDGVAGNPTLGLDIVGVAAAGEDAAAADLFILNNDSASANQAFTLAEVANGISSSLSLAYFNAVSGDSGTATADIVNDALSLVGAANGGITTAATDGPEQVTFAITPIDLTTGGATLALGDFIIVSDSADAAGDTALKYTFTDMVQDLDIPNAISSNGMVVRTAADTYASRSIAVNGAGNLAGLAVTNGDGSSGNPTLGVDIQNAAAAGENLATGDEILIYNTSASANQTLTGQELADGVSAIIGLASSLADADGDTRMQVEEAADEDIIRFDVGDTPTGYGAVADIMTLASSGLTVAMGTATGTGTAGAPISFTTGVGGPTNGNGGALSLITGAGGATGSTSDGGAMTITAGNGGDAGGSGGGITVTTGTGVGGSGRGGDLLISTGAGTGDQGGDMTVTLGAGASGSQGGSFALQAGSGGSVTGGGDVQIGGGITTGGTEAAGSVGIFGGLAGGGSGDGGDITLNAGSSAGGSNGQIITGIFGGGGGTAALPILTFNGDTDTGIYSDTADHVSVSAAGTRVGDFDANGLTLVNDLRLEDTAGGEFVGLSAPGTVTSYTLTFPAGVGSTGQVLRAADGAGTLEFATLSSSSITDADADTLIQVEEAADEDIIRFDVGDAPAGYGAVANIMTLASSGWTVAMGTADTATTAGAPISLTAGTGNTTGVGGSASLIGGDGGTGAAGGDVNITAGSAGTGSNANGGNIVLTPGALDGSGSDGTVRVVGPTSGTAGEMRLEDNSGGEYIGLQAAGTISSSFTLTLPSADSTGTQALVSNGSGTLSFSDFVTTGFTTVTGDTGTATADTTTDSLAIVDATNGGIATVATDGPEQVTIALDFADLTALGAAPAVGDLLAVADVSNSNAMRSITVTQLASAVSGASELNDLSDVDTTAEAAGFALIFDNAAGTWEAKKIFHEETFTSQTSVTFSHNLNNQYPVITVYDNSDQQIIPASATADSATAMTVTFAVSTTGRIVLVAPEVA